MYNFNLQYYSFYAYCLSFCHVLGIICSSVGFEIEVYIYKTMI